MSITESHPLLSISFNETQPHLISPGFTPHAFQNINPESINLTQSCLISSISVNCTQTHSSLQNLNQFTRSLSIWSNLTYCHVIETNHIITESHSPLSISFNHNLISSQPYPYLISHGVTYTYTHLNVIITNNIQWHMASSKIFTGLGIWSSPCTCIYIGP